MKIGVVGAGWCGLTTAVGYAELGHDVACVDVSEERIAALKNGECPIFEKELPELLKKHTITFTTSLAEATKDAEAIIICVGTPPKKDGSADTSYVEQVAKDLCDVLDQYTVVVVKSTVPVGTTRRVKEILKDKDVDVAMNPEFLRESTAVHDFLNPDRIVVGAETQKAHDVMDKVYAPLKPTMVHTNLESAELIKQCANSFLAMKISFANMVSRLCEKTNADIQMVMKGIGLDDRIGSKFLNAGLGFGGMCFPKDVDAFIAVLKEHNVDSSMMEAAISINTAQLVHVRDKAKDMLGGLQGKTIGVLGLAFKPNTDDVRVSQAIRLVELLQKDGAQIRAYDPQAMENAKKVLTDVTFCNSAEEVAEGADLVLLATEWKEFADLDLSKVSKLLDARNMFDPEKMKGIDYQSIGR